MSCCLIFLLVCSLIFLFIFATFYAICNLFHLVTFGAHYPECGQVLLRIVFSFTKYSFILNQSVILREWIHEGFSFAFLDQIKLEFILFLSDGVNDVHSVLFSLRGKWLIFFETVALLPFIACYFLGGLNAVFCCFIAQFPLACLRLPKALLHLLLISFPSFLAMNFRGVTHRSWNDRASLHVQ